jgi:hypothetical protein
VTGTGKVIREIEPGSLRRFPRLWLPKGAGVRVGGSLPASFAPATRALAAAQEARIPRRVKGVRSSAGELTLVLKRGPEIRLGPTGVRLGSRWRRKSSRSCPGAVYVTSPSDPCRAGTSTLGRGLMLKPPAIDTRSEDSRRRPLQQSQVRKAGETIEI